MAVSIASVGARTPVGLCADATACAVRAGISRLQFHPRFVDRTGEPMRVAMDGMLGPEVRLLERMVAIGRSAAEEALFPLRERGKPKVAVYIGLPEERPGWTRDDGQFVVRGILGACADSCTVDKIVSFPRGHAAGLLALESAVEAVERGTTELALVGGVDSYLAGPTLEWLDDNRQLANDANRSAFTPGEGAAFCLIARKGVARTLGATEFAHLLGVASTHEPKAIKTDAICIGEGLTNAIRGATRNLRLPEQKISQTYCDINGERYRSEEFMYVPLRHWAPFVDANRYAAPADCWGDVGAASGPLFLALAAISGRRGYAKGDYVLVWASSEGGSRAAAALELSRGGAR